MPKTTRITILAAALLISSCDRANNHSPAEGADVVLTGGRIYTEDARNPWAQAVAIKGKRFVYVGDDQGAEPHVGQTTERIDLGGRLVLPGLIDGHTHPGMMGIERFGPSLPESGHEELLAAVKAYADSAPDEAWIRMCCWSEYQYVHGRDGPHKRDLDEIVPDRPVWITSSSWHSYWLNSKALEALGVDKSTPDPRPGKPPRRPGQGRSGPRSRSRPARCAVRRLSWARAGRHAEVPSHCRLDGRHEGREDTPAAAVRPTPMSVAGRPAHNLAA